MPRARSRKISRFLNAHLAFKSVGLYGAVVLALVTVATNRLFPSVQRVVIVSENSSAAADNDSSHAAVYKVFYKGHQPGNSGFLGIGHTRPVWFYSVWVFNGSDADLRGLYISARTTDDAFPIQFIGKNLRQSPDAPPVQIISAAHDSRKIQFYVDALPRGQAAAYSLAVESDAMPEVGEIALSVNSGGTELTTVSDKAWERIGWHGFVPR